MNTSVSDSATQLLNKVPEVTLLFWIIKIMATTVGETGADFLIFNLHFGLTNTSIIMGVLLLVFLVIQIRYRQYVPWIYWVAVVLISVFGALVTDNLVDNFDVALITTTVVFSVFAAAGRSQEYRLGGVGEAEANVVGQEADLTTLVKNLVDNAIRYTPDGGRIDLSVRASGNHVILQIDDTGPGIAECGPGDRLFGNISLIRDVQAVRPYPDQARLWLK